ncbi:MAG: hypothetical protein SOR72_04415 [Hornefia sp.]|nr:hypothetical protein [Hornefia sp.]
MKWNKYMEAVSEQKEFEKNQEKLHEKYEDIEDEKVIVETSNSYKFTVNLIKNITKGIAGIMSIILSTIGILTLIYPNIRYEFFKVLNQILLEVKNML